MEGVYSDREADSMELGEERGERQPTVCYQASHSSGPWSLAHLESGAVWRAQRDSPTGQGSGVLCPTSWHLLHVRQRGPWRPEKSSFREASVLVVEQQTVPRSGKGRGGASTELSRC